MPIYWLFHKKATAKGPRVSEYRITNRGGKGVKTINITDKTGPLVAIKEVIDTDDLMIINRSGIIIRLGISNLRVMGRATQGVRLIKLNENDEISSVATIKKISDDLDENIENEDVDNEEQNENKE